MKTTKGLGLFAAGAGVGLALGVAGLALAQAALPAPTGPTQPNVLGQIDLGKDFPQMAGYTLTLRMTTAPPGAGRAMHSHKGTPEIVHIVSGVMTEQEPDGKIATFGPGSNHVNQGDRTHMFLNMGKEPLVYIAAGVAKTTP